MSTYERVFTLHFSGPILIEDLEKIPDIEKYLTEARIEPTAEIFLKFDKDFDHTKEMEVSNDLLIDLIDKKTKEEAQHITASQRFFKSVQAKDLSVDPENAASLKREQDASQAEERKFKR